MTLAGWIFMITSWTVILSVFVYCLVRTLRQKPADLPRCDLGAQGRPAEPPESP